MKIQIHDIVAECPRCNGREFEPLTPEPLQIGRAHV